MERRGGAAPIVAGLLLLFVLLAAYLGSLGPAIYLREASYIPPETVGCIYAPLGWLADHSSHFATILNWYVRLWATN
jgi:hypothetical protein